jgi:acrylyl-CoA reductase (NADPH)
MELPTSVAPFILRGVALLGVESVRPRLALRQEAWTRLANDLDVKALEAMSETIPFTQALDRAKTIVKGAIRGRIVIEMP